MFIHFRLKTKIGYYQPVVSVFILANIKLEFRVSRIIQLSNSIPTQKTKETRETIKYCKSTIYFNSKIIN